MNNLFVVSYVDKKSGGTKLVVATGDDHGTVARRFNAYYKGMYDSYEVLRAESFKKKWRIKASK